MRFSLRRVTPAHCPYCTEVLDGALPLFSCQECGTELHGSCAIENQELRRRLVERSPEDYDDLGPCTTFGCWWATEPLEAELIQELLRAPIRVQQRR